MVLNISVVSRSESELALEIKEIRESMEQKKINGGFLSTLKHQTRLICKMQFLRPFTFICVTLVGLEWSSFAFLAFYMVNVFRVRVL